MNREARAKVAWDVSTRVLQMTAGTPLDVDRLTRTEPVGALLRGALRVGALGGRLAAGGRAHTPPHTVEGAGPGLVLVSGWTASGLAWPAQLVAELARRWTVVRIENRGTALARRAPRPFTMADLADDVRRVVDAVGLERPTVVGLSMGGMIAQELALRAPASVGHLVLLGTKPPSPEDTLPPPAVRERLFRTPAPGEALRDFLRDGWAEMAAPGFVETRWEAMDEMAAAMAERPTPRSGALDQARAVTLWSGAARLRGVAVPTTVVHGAQDPLVPVRNGMRLAQLIPGARYVELADVGHLVPYEAPDDVAAVVEAGRN